MPKSKQLATKINRTPIELTNVTAFGHEFKGILPGIAAKLITLEKEGATYSKMWYPDRSKLNYIRIKYLPAEIVRYVEGLLAQQEFFEGMKRFNGDKERALDVVSNKKIAEEVRSYKALVNHKGKIIGMDLRGNVASFVGKDLEELEMGIASPSRYEILPEISTKNKIAIILEIFDAFSSNVNFLSKRKHSRPAFKIENEYDVQDLLYVIVKSIFPDSSLEEYTPKHAGATKRIDIVLPSSKVVIEAKYIRNASHAQSISNELKVDIESYHVHPSCKTLCIFVYDPSKHILDPAAVVNDLSGMRTIGGTRFETSVTIKT